MKLMIMNYKPYEYELLQEKLNQYGQEGYLTHDLTLLTTFQKMKHPVYYKIDFYRPEGHNKKDKYIDEQAFIDRYQQKGFQNIYKKHHMYVFVIEKKRDLSIDWELKDDIVQHSFRLLSLGAAFLSIVAFSMILYYSSQASYDKFMSYGILIAFLGILLALIASAYRNYLNFYGMSIFHSKLKKSNPHFKLHKLALLRKPYFICILISVIFMIGGLIEDTFNAKSFTQNEHPIMTLKDLGIDKKTSLSTQMYSGFVIPHSYISLEKTNDDALYIKEYQFSSSHKSQDLFKQFQLTPNQYGANHIEVKNNIIYGYYNKDIVSLVIMKEKSVILILPSFALTETHIDEITNFYSI